MLLLFEGVDKSGKSTLLRNFRDAYPNSGYWKNTIYKPNSAVLSRGIIQGLYLGFYEAAKQMIRGRYPFAVDRSHITEIVYAPIKRNYEPDIAFWREYEDQLDAIVIYVDTPPSTVINRLNIEGDDYVSIDDVIRIKYGYDDYFHRFTRLSVIRIDGSKTEAEMLQELIVKVDEYLRARS